MLCTKYSLDFVVYQVNAGPRDKDQWTKRLKEARFESLLQIEFCRH